jgi:hypothetical protein
MGLHADVLLSIRRRATDGSTEQTACRTTASLGVPRTFVGKMDEADGRGDLELLWNGDLRDTRMNTPQAVREDT